MPDAVTLALTWLLILAAAVWVGGLVAIFVVARVASRTLQPAARVSFFRALGRAYGIVGTVALAIAYGTGAALLVGRPWDALLVATVIVAAVLVVTTTAGVVQARRMRRLRQRVLAQPDDPVLAAGVRRGAVRAAGLRGLLALLSLALLTLAVLLGG
ncbi:hypothetical protein [Blastococcus saxobsidens]|uniref:DUF2269 family protein n=1 Tax=Blastococcus saxobsidens (strain DD2) TaxID=1146883 RepID=H6RU66_BLASD|nr:hypothetical protein [Blastococcus saxobsidens]CCG05673.1 conserved membrane protein of unknown function, putative permease domain [Blastococcus saxobsidens DD2]